MICHPPRLLALIVLMLALAGCHTIGRDVPGVDNFAQVSPRLYRGAQPSQRGIATLKQHGVTTIINLRHDPDPREPVWAAHAGMRYVLLASRATHVEPAKVRMFLSDVANSPGPVFVHCRQGRDRTGLDVAAYRIVEQDWTRSAALNDLYDHGYHWLLFPGIASSIKRGDFGGQGK